MSNNEREYTSTEGARVQEDTGQSRPIILREQPLQTATEFHRIYGEKLRRYRHTWYRYEGPNYRMVSTEEANLDITEFLSSGVEPTGTTFHPKPGDVSATLQMLMKYRPAIMEPTVPMPGWLPEATDTEKEHDPRDLVSCKNGLIDLRTDECIPHTPRLLTTSTTSYHYSPRAKRKRFEKFLDEIFPGSTEKRPDDFETWSEERQEPQLQNSFRRSSDTSSRATPGSRRFSCSLGNRAPGRALSPGSYDACLESKMSSAFPSPLWITTSAPRI
jgi:D5 N terminal like